MDSALEMCLEHLPLFLFSFRLFQPPIQLVAHTSNHLCSPCIQANTTSFSNSMSLLYPGSCFRQVSNLCIPNDADSVQDTHLSLALMFHVCSIIVLIFCRDASMSGVQIRTPRPCWMCQQRRTSRPSCWKLTSERQHRPSLSSGDHL